MVLPLTSEPLEHCVRVLRDAFVLCGAKASDNEWKTLIERTYSWWLTFIDDHPGNHWVKIVKYKVSAFVAWLLGQDDIGNMPSKPPGIPETDNPAVLFGGKIYRWTRGLRVFNRRLTLILAQTVNQAKFGMPKPDEAAVALAVRSTFKTLTTKKPQPKGSLPVFSWEDTCDGDFLLPYDSSHTTLTAEVAKDQIRRTVRELFCGLDHNDRVIGRRVRPYEESSMNSEQVPSTSSSYESRVVDGGNFSHIHHWWQNVEGMALMEFLDPDPIKIEVESTPPNRPTLIYDASKLRAESNIYRHMLREKAAESMSYTRIVGLSEALKVRPITQGNPFQQTALDTLQKWLHRTVRQNPAFSLIGEEVTAEYMSQRLGHRPLAPDEVLMSGDYRAATDGMYAEYTAIVPEVLLEEGLINETTYILMMDNLVGNRIENPETFEDAHQEEGQLMGSITSFPVLCIVNGALCRWVLECQYRRMFSLAGAPMMINGDDNAWRGRWIRSHRAELNRSPIQFFEEVCKYFSFELSVGKTFSSRDMVVINSTMFRAVPHRIGGRQALGLELVPYYSMAPFSTQRGRSGPPVSCRESLTKLKLREMGIVNPDSWRNYILSEFDRGDKVLNRAFNLGTLNWINVFRRQVGLDPLTELLAPDDHTEKTHEAVFGTRLYNDVAVGTFVADCLRQAPHYGRVEYYRLIMKHWFPILTSVQVPWYIPESLGGLGFPAMDATGTMNGAGPHLFGPTTLDRQIATRILFAMQTGDFARSPVSVRSRVPFRVHKLIMGGKLRQFTRMFHPDDPEYLAGQEFYGKLVFAAYLHQPLLELFDTDDSGYTSKQAYTHNRHIWQASSYTSLINSDRSVTVEKIWEASELKQGLMARPARFRDAGSTPDPEVVYASEDDDDHEVKMSIMEGPQWPNRRVRILDAPDLFDRDVTRNSVLEESLRRHLIAVKREDSSHSQLVTSWVRRVSQASAAP